jgi:anti-sigma28 factor (negative regulator of flagellin synthesis)
MAQAPQGEKAPLHGQPPARTHVTRQIMITALRCAVVSGTYNVKAEHIIDKMFAAILVDMLV